MDNPAASSKNKKERLRKIAQLTLLGLAVLAYAGLCTVVFLYFPPYVVAVLILLTIIVVLGVDALTSRRRLATIEEDTRKLSDQAKLFKRTFLSDNEVMLSSLKKNIAIIDETHHIYSIEHDVVLKGRKLIVSYTFRGKNSSDKPTDGIRYKLIGKMPANLKELDHFNVSVSDPDYDRDDSWEAKITGKEPYYMVVAAPFLPFKRSISPGENFCLRLSLTWMNSTSFSASYLVFYSSNFRKEVERYKVKVRFDITPIDLRLYRVEYGPKGLDLHDDEETFERDPTDPKTFTWDKTSPGAAYVLVFARNLPQFEDQTEKEGAL